MNIGNPFEGPSRDRARHEAERAGRQEVKEKREAAAASDAEFEAAGGKLPEGGRMYDADQTFAEGTEVTKNIGMSEQEAEKSFGLDESESDEAAA